MRQTLTQHVLGLRGVPQRRRPIPLMTNYIDHVGDCTVVNGLYFLPNFNVNDKIKSLREKTLIIYSKSVLWERGKDPATKYFHSF